MLTKDQFCALAAQGHNHVPLSLETFADLDTPLSIYLKLANGPYTYLLESVQGDQKRACEILAISRATLWRRLKQG